MDQKQFVATIQGTVLEEAMNVNLDDVISPGGKVEDEDTILGTMTDLEKGFLALVYQAADKLKTIHADCIGGDKDSGEMESLYQQCKEIQERASLIPKLMWTLIELRLGSGNMSIQEGFQIVTRKDDWLSGIRIIDIGGSGIMDLINSLGGRGGPRF